MIRLDKEILLYHGSYVEIPDIDLAECRRGKDFGQGFYVTSSLDQAESFVKLAINREIKSKSLSADTSFGYVNIYKFSPGQHLNMRFFEYADEAWLHFVAANRRHELFPELIAEMQQYDIIAGKIANDRTAQTLQIYVAGGYGQPGTEQADQMAIKMLLPNRLQNQFCFKTARAISTLKFLGSTRYEI